MSALVAYLLGLATVPALAALLYGALWLFDTQGVTVCKFDQREITVWRHLPDWNHHLHFWRHHRAYIRTWKRVEKQKREEHPEFNTREINRAVQRQMRADHMDLLPPQPEATRVPVPQLAQEWTPDPDCPPPDPDAPVRL